LVSRVVVADVPWIKPDSSHLANLRACLGLARKIRAGNYDLAVDLRYHNRLDSLLLSLCGARRRLGFNAGNMGFGLTHRARRPRTGHEVARMSSALEGAGIRVKSRDTLFPVPAMAARSAARKLGPAGGNKLVAFHPGAGNAIKRWMPERFAMVAKELVRRHGVRVVLLGGPGESGLGAGIVKSVPRRSLADLRGKLSLAEMGAVLGKCRLFIGNDGGPAHIAGAVGTPTLVVFSGTSVAADWAPRGKQVRVIEKTVPCKPCYSTTCPFGQACLRRIGCEEVIGLANKMLRGR
jgi:ADP-heptose:LPS heptosyltransferase